MSYKVNSNNIHNYLLYSKIITLGSLIYIPDKNFKKKNRAVSAALRLKGFPNKKPDYFTANLKGPEGLYSYFSAAEKLYDNCNREIKWSTIPCITKQLISFRVNPFNQEKDVRKWYHKLREKNWETAEDTAERTLQLLTDIFIENSPYDYIRDEKEIITYIHSELHRTNSSESNTIFDKVRAALCKDQSKYFKSPITFLKDANYNKSQAQPTQN